MQNIDFKRVPISRSGSSWLDWAIRR